MVDLRPSLHRRKPIPSCVYLNPLLIEVCVLILRAKPQNRTEVSPTTTECSTIELELPVLERMMCHVLWRGGLEPPVDINLTDLQSAALPIRRTFTLINLCLGEDSNFSLRIFSSVLYLMSYRGFKDGEIGTRTLTPVMQTRDTSPYIISPSF